jgi:branched-chain amino acid transport system ATP-binding protein
MAMAGLPNPSEGLMLLDEPAAGLSPEERADMMERVKRMTDKGTTVLYTEHNMDAVFGVADRVLVLIDGQLVAQGTADEVAANAVVRERYLGQTFSFKQDSEHA